MDRVRLAVVINDLGGGGAERMLARVVTRLRPDEFDVKVFSLTNFGPSGELLVEAGIPVLAMDLLKRPVNPWNFFALVRELKRFQPDVLQGWMYLGNLFGGFAAKWVRRDLPVIWNVRHSTLDPRIDSRGLRWSAWLGGKLSRWVPDHILLNAEAARSAHLRVGYAADKLEVIPNGFDVAEFRPDSESRRNIREELGLAHDTPLVGLVGRLHPHKDHRTFLQAARAVAGRLPNVHFVLVGEELVYTVADAWNWIDQVGLRHRFHVLGIRKDLAAINASLDLSVCSSTTEGFPNVIGEAMSCGVPCVTTDVGECAEVVGDTGRVVPKQNPQRLAEAVVELLTLPHDVRVALGQAARHRIVERYDIEKIVARYRRLWRTTAGVDVPASLVEQHRAA
jgi:glycosyltransferase involved in cell wall biosynthesis